MLKPIENWKRVTGSISPVAPVDKDSSKFYVYIRKNAECIEKKEKESLISFYEYDERKIDKNFYNTASLETLKGIIKDEVGTACQNAIYNGIDVETTQGVEHFSLAQNDQINIAGLYTKVMSGELFAVPYHADGQLCRFFTKEEFTKIAETAEYWKTYNTTLCNHINYWINRCDTKDELLTISYDAQLPADLQEALDALLELASANNTEETPTPDVIDPETDNGGKETVNPSEGTDSGSEEPVNPTEEKPDEKENTEDASKTEGDKIPESNTESETEETPNVDSTDETQGNETHETDTEETEETTDSKEDGDNNFVDFGTTTFTTPSVDDDSRGNPQTDGDTSVDM